MTDIDALSELLPFCKTERQSEVIETLLKTGSQYKAAKVLDVHRSTIRDCLRTIQGYSEKRGLLGKMKEEGVVPPGYFAETSVQRRLNEKTGQLEVVADWTKSRIDKNTLKESEHLALIEGLSTQIVKAKSVKASTKKITNELVSAVIIGDAHIGSLAHAVETLGEDHDLETATEDIRAAIDYLIDVAPASETGWLINVGDFIHVNDHHNNTYGSTPQDTSANFSVVLRAAGLTLRYCVDQMLTKFRNVVVVNARGNHDLSSALALNLYMQAVYENEPRVQIPDNDAKFHFIEFGECLIGINHGDKINASRLAGVMTRNAAEAWGRTSFRRWWLGHIHHKITEEHDSGIVLESFNTLAPIDAWHSGAGYGSEQRITMITLHKKFGEVQRVSPSLEMIRTLRAKP